MRSVVFLLVLLALGGEAAAQTPITIAKPLEVWDCQFPKSEVPSTQRIYVNEKYLNRTAIPNPNGTDFEPMGIYDVNVDNDEALVAVWAMGVVKPSAAYPTDMVPNIGASTIMLNKVKGEIGEGFSNLYGKANFLVRGTCKLGSWPPSRRNGQ